MRYQWCEYKVYPIGSGMRQLPGEATLTRNKRHRSLEAILDPARPVAISSIPVNNLLVLIYKQSYLIKV